MRILETKTHGYLDYIVGVLLIGAPWILDFERGGAETWVPVILGIGTIGYSIFTDYELGAIRRIPMRTHLTLDFINGALLASSPWLFGFADYIWAPHVIIGLLEIGVAVITKTGPTTAKGHGGRVVGAH